VLVNEQCVVIFKIGSYYDEVLCDVMKMNFCHLLLGRFWQFDKKVVHDGCANTYSLMKDGVHHKLKPLDEIGSKVCSKVGIFLVSYLKQLEKKDEGEKDDLLMQLEEIR